MLFYNARILMKLGLGVMAIGLVYGCSAATNHPAPSHPETVQTALNDQTVKELEQLNSIAENMVEYAKKGEPLQARDQLNQLSQQLTKVHYEGLASIEGLDALTGSVVSARRVFNAVKYSPEQGMLAAIKVHLAVDALTHKEQPLWIRYYRTLDEMTNSLARALQTQDLIQAKRVFSDLQQQYLLIRPAILISREPSMVEMADSLFAYCTTRFSAATADKKELVAAVRQLDQVWMEIFQKGDREAYISVMYPREPLVWSTIVGAIIIAVLAFVGWQKFKNDRGYVTVKKRTNDDS